MRIIQKLTCSNRSWILASKWDSNPSKQEHETRTQFRRERHAIWVKSSAQRRRLLRPFETSRAALAELDGVMSGFRKYVTPEEIEARSIELWARGYNEGTISACLKKLMPGREKTGGVTLSGCYRDDLLWHIERQFYPSPIHNIQMDWRNKAMWHIDHIIPKSSFDWMDKSLLRECWHWTNLRPLWVAENMKKGSKIQHAWHVPFEVRKTWQPRDTFIGPDGLTHHNSERTP